MGSLICDGCLVMKCISDSYVPVQSESDQQRLMMSELVEGKEIAPCRVFRLLKVEVEPDIAAEVCSGDST